MTITIDTTIKEIKIGRVYFVLRATKRGIEILTPDGWIEVYPTFFVSKEDILEYQKETKQLEGE